MKDNGRVGGRFDDEQDGYEARIRRKRESRHAGVDADSLSVVAVRNRYRGCVESSQDISLTVRVTRFSCHHP